MDFKITQIEARDIPDAWFQCVSKVQEVGFKYEIQHGSYVGQTRMEFDFIVIQINHPYSEPYETMLPDIPQHLNIPNPVAPDYINQYLSYVMSDKKEDKESYTYGQRLNGYSIPHAIIHGLVMDKENYIDGLKSIIGPSRLLNQTYLLVDILRRTPNTNQAILQVAQPTDCLLKDPPCLRHIDMRVKDGELHFYPYFRSWDLWNGMPANLQALAIYQKFIADLVDIEVGKMVCSSKGLHLYGYVEELAKLRVGK